MDLGQKLKRARKNKGFSAVELATRVGVTSRAIYQYESNKHNPRYPTLEKICLVLGLDPLTVAPYPDNYIYWRDTLLDLYDDAWNKLAQSDDNRDLYWSDIVDYIHREGY